MISSRAGAAWSTIGAPVSKQRAPTRQHMTCNGLRTPSPPPPRPPPSARVNAGSGQTFHSQVTRGNHRQTRQPHAKRTHDTLHPLPLPSRGLQASHARTYKRTPPPTANLALINVMGSKWPHVCEEPTQRRR